MNTYRQKGFSGGFSIVEVMVSLVIGMLILAAILTVFIGNRSSFRFNDQSARLQENGRFVMGLLENDLRQAAYAGCVRTGVDHDDYDDVAKGFTEVQEAITTMTGWGEFTKETLVQGVNWKVDSGKESLQIFGVPTDGFVLWSDCDGDTAINPAGTTPPSPPPPISVSSGWKAYTLNAGTLSMSVNGTGNDELIRDVAKFQVCVGLDDGTTTATIPGSGIEMDEVIDRWIRATGSAPTADQWQAATAIKVDLVLASAEDHVLEAGGTPPTFTLCDNTTFTPADVDANGDRLYKLYKHFRSTITLRNKVPNSWGRGGRCSSTPTVQCPS
ncbi:MAG: PilW family protein [Zoogloeaceae bacterium]|jgi:Tfp pilus assembly protein PilV|nr:PilW family protein [Zoogloeaceae bacterium]